jgi:hypothetical protein
MERFGESKEDRRFGWLPVPKVTADKAGEQTMLSLNNSYGFISANCEKMELAKEFMRFLHTDAEMSKFTSKTSVTRSLRYTMSSEDFANATSFGKSVISMKNNTKVVYPYSTEKIVADNAYAFAVQNWYSTSIYNGMQYNTPLRHFQAGDMTAKDYFNGLYDYQKRAWNRLAR